MHRHIALAVLLTAALLSASCATRSGPPPAPVAVLEQRTPQAQAAFNYLKFQTAKRDGDVATATEALNVLLGLAPSPEIYQQGADFLWRTGRTGEARALLKRALELYPESRDLTVALANTYYADKRHEDAILTIEDYLERVPEDWQSHKDMALIHLDNSQFAEAIENLKAIPEEHLDASALYYWAKAASGLGLNRLAREKLRSAVQMDAYFLEAWAELAYLYEIDGNLVEAEKVYNRLLDLGETSNEVYLRLISLNIKLNNPDRALSLYFQGSGDAGFALEAASQFLDDNFFEQARAILVPLSERSDAPDRIWFYMAVLAYDGDRDAEQALDYLERVPEDDQHFHRAARFRIHLLMEHHPPQEALRLIRRLKRSYPEQTAYYSLESSFHQRQGDYAAAKQVLETALEKWPENTELLYAYGSVQERLGRLEASMATMERIIVLDPEHADALNYVGYLLADEGKDLERATVLVERALDIEPDNGYIIDSLAWIHYRLGTFEKAWELVQLAVERVADQPEIWEHYGDIAAALGKLDKAREGYRNCLELEPGREGVQDKLDAL